MKSLKELSIVFKNIFKEFKQELHNIHNLQKVDYCKSKYLGKKSVLIQYFKKIKKFSVEMKKKYSFILNNFKQKILENILIKKKDIKRKILENKKNIIQYDVSLPGRRIETGSLHPVTIIIQKILSFFLKMGFISLEGPEIEDEYHNFDALNIPQNHPSKNFSDTFWFDSNRLLRTQTSSMQIRALEKYEVPFRIVIPGKVYRYDLDSTHTPMFHQIEGLIIEPLISFTNLKWFLNLFLQDIFSTDIKTRFRNSYFPFTMPSLEMDIQNSEGSWLEILGGGIVHPNVLKKFNINSEKYSACAFGIGVERIAMLKYNISDIRYFFENNINFLKQFKKE